MNLLTRWKEYMMPIRKKEKKKQSWLSCNLYVLSGQKNNYTAFTLLFETIQLLFGTIFVTRKSNDVNFETIIPFSFSQLTFGITWSHLMNIRIYDAIRFFRRRKISLRFIFPTFLLSCSTERKASLRAKRCPFTTCFKDSLEWTGRRGEAGEFAH